MDRTHPRRYLSAGTWLLLAAAVASAACGEAPVRSVADAVARANGRQVEVTVRDRQRFTLDSVRVVGDSLFGVRAQGSGTQAVALAMKDVRAVGWSDGAVVLRDAPYVWRDARRPAFARRVLTSR